VSIPRVSVIIPTFNRSEYIKDSINSVFNQTYRDIEVIICDDASTDDTLRVINSIKSNSPFPIHVEVLLVNLGVSAARNQAIFLAKGELIAFLDSDDSWKPEKIEKQVDFLDKNPDYIGVGCSFEFLHDDEVKNIFKSRKEIRQQDELFELLYQCYITTSCFLVKKNSLILAGLFDLSLNISEDRDLWWRLPRLGRVGFINEVLVTYRVHNKSISKLSISSTAKTYIPTIEKTIWFWKDKLNIKEQRMIISRAHLLVAYDACEANELFLCAKHVLKSLSNYCNSLEALKLFLNCFAKKLIKFNFFK
jgi:glycosyltransferase involved in cell wall biosynthesis